MGKEGKYDLRLADPPVITETDTETETDDDEGCAGQTNASETWPHESSTPCKIKYVSLAKFTIF